MKSVSIILIALAASTGVSRAADSPFAGAWKLDVARSKFTGDTFSYSKTPTGLRYSNGSTVAYGFAMDGKDYPTVGNRTVAWSKAADGGWDVTVKAGGKVVSKTHRLLSPDGKTLMSSYTEYRPDGVTSHESDVAQRVSGTSGLEGEWKDVKVQAESVVMTIAMPAAGRFQMAIPSYKEVIAGPTDGTPVPIQGPTIPPGAMASYKAEGPRTWTYTVTLKGKVYEQGRMTVAADGRTLTDESWVPGKAAETSVAVYSRA